MLAMNLREISRVCKGRLVSDKDVIITDITTDSRNAKSGSLFAAIVGERTDGHSYIAAAKKLGAAAVLCEREIEDADIPYIVTDSTLKALQAIASHMLRTAGIAVVGIGGSVGKTSTKEAVAAVLEQKLSVLKTQGNFNNDLGLPLTVFNLKEKNQAAVLEMGISDFHEMHLLADIARPDICVLTNIGDCHLENLGDRAGVFRAKSEMFDFLEPKGHMVLNGDDAYLSTVKEINKVRPVFYGLDKKNDVWADNIVPAGIFGTSCDVHTRAGDFSVCIPRPGEHMVYNALAAAAVGLIMNLSLDEIKKGIEAQESVGGRLNIIKENSLTIIDDCYNANPMSMKASLEVLSRAKERRVAVLGDMGELGENSIGLHREVGEFASGLNLELIICIGELSRHIAEALKAKSSVLCFDDIQSFIEQKDDIIKSGDCILVKASHFMGFDAIVNALRDKR